ncbi:MAG: hypothetical protein AMXMBFR34_49040 [Myxococcaceae bacterium]
MSRLPPLARAAIAIFPDDPGCEAPSSLAVAFTQAPPLEALLLRTPVGGTPTAAALRFAASVPELADASADSLIVLITDGLPNCNPQHPGNACGTGSGSCRCTLSACNSLCSIGCLDDQATVQVYRELGARGIRVITVIVGPDWDSELGQLTTSLLAGVEVPRPCVSECPPHLLHLRSADDLMPATVAMAASLSRCAYRLDAPPAPQQPLEAEVSGRLLAPAEFSVLGDRVILAPAACNGVQAGQSLSFFVR